MLYNKHSFKCVGDRLAIQFRVGNNLLTNTLEKQIPTFGNDPMPTLFSKITLLEKDGRIPFLRRSDEGDVISKFFHCVSLLLTNNSPT